jgi:hypothetical protein
MTISFFEQHGGLIRICLYLAFLLWSILLFFLCIARLNYTDHRRNEASLNGGNPFYGKFILFRKEMGSLLDIDPSVVELLVCAMLGIAFSVFM